MKLIGESKPAEGFSYRFEREIAWTIFSVDELGHAVGIAMDTFAGHITLQRIVWRLEMMPAELAELRKLYSYAQMMFHSPMVDGGEMRTLAAFLHVSEVKIVQPMPEPSTVEEWREADRKKSEAIRALFGALDRVAPAAAQQAMKDTHLSHIMSCGPMPVEKIALLRRPDGHVHGVRMTAPLREGERGRRSMTFSASAADGLGDVTLLEPCEVTSS